MRGIQPVPSVEVHTILISMRFFSYINHARVVPSCMAVSTFTAHTQIPTIYLTDKFLCGMDDFWNIKFSVVFQRNNYLTMTAKTVVAQEHSKEIWVATK